MTFQAIIAPSKVNAPRIAARLIGSASGPAISAAYAPVAFGSISILQSRSNPQKSAAERPGHSMEFDEFRVSVQSADRWNVHTNRRALNPQRLHQSDQNNRYIS